MHHSRVSGGAVRRTKEGKEDHRAAMKGEGRNRHRKRSAIPSKEESWYLFGNVNRRRGEKPRNWS